MEPIIWVVVALQSALLPFTLAFFSMTLLAGKSLVLPSDLESNDPGLDVGRLIQTGFQGAIIPPWLKSFALVVYLSIVVSVVVAWWVLGWRMGLCSIGVLTISSVLLKRLFNKYAQGFFIASIFKSMIRRNERWLLAGDQSKADVMGTLIGRIEVMMYEDSDPANPVH
jgi:hypothetical protein